MTKSEIAFRRIKQFNLINREYRPSSNRSIDVVIDVLGVGKNSLSHFLESNSTEALPYRGLRFPRLIADLKYAELIDDQRFSLVESEYWDETHDWGEEASSEYWHFLGQYE